MFIRQYLRKKDGKRHAYWALVESFRTDAGPRQRVVAWLGKLDEADRLGVEQAARDTDQSSSNGSATTSSRQQFALRTVGNLVDRGWLWKLFADCSSMSSLRKSYRPAASVSHGGAVR